jgi:hypothetical protein
MSGGGGELDSSTEGQNVPSVCGKRRKPDDSNDMMRIEHSREDHFEYRQGRGPSSGRKFNDHRSVNKRHGRDERSACSSGMDRKPLNGVREGHERPATKSRKLETGDRCNEDHNPGNQNVTAPKIIFEPSPFDRLRGDSSKLKVEGPDSKGWTWCFDQTEAQFLTETQKCP